MTYTDEKNENEKKKEIIEIARKIATDSSCTWREEEICFFCRSPFELHDEDCNWIKLRKLLGITDEAV